MPPELSVSSDLCRQTKSNIKKSPEKPLAKYLDSSWLDFEVKLRVITILSFGKCKKINDFFLSNISNDIQNTDSQRSVIWNKF